MDLGGDFQNAGFGLAAQCAMIPVALVIGVEPGRDFQIARSGCAVKHFHLHW